ncbi:MAG: DUF721 domain-containing protein [Candidatus Rokubacteria bacterium]|nr:DUF721 domain-containing protein [Candidatus Rokubacteria bacterium]
MTRARRESPVRVGDLLAGAVPGLDARLLLDRIRRQWVAVVGPDAARRSQPVDLSGDTLGIAVDNSPWLQELRLRSADLLAAVTRRFGPGVTTLRFFLGRAEARPAPAAAHAPVAPMPLTPEEARAVEELTGHLEDEALANALRRVLTKDFLARRRRIAGGSLLDASPRRRR